MLQTTLRDRATVSDFYQLRFEAGVNGPSSCERGLDNVFHRTSVLNPTWGSRIRRATIEYWTDSSSARLCSGTVVECPLGGEAKAFQFPPQGQQYWAGAEKTIEIKACWAGTGAERDFNVSYAVEIDIDARGISQHITPIRFESNMHVQVA
jgi:hypothetical protein